MRELALSAAICPSSNRSTADEPGPVVTVSPARSGIALPHHPRRRRTRLRAHVARHAERRGIRKDEARRQRRHQAQHPNHRFVSCCLPSHAVPDTHGVRHRWIPRKPSPIWSRRGACRPALACTPAPIYPDAVKSAIFPTGCGAFLQQWLCHGRLRLRPDLVPHREPQLGQQALRFRLRRPKLLESRRGSARKAAASSPAGTAPPPRWPTCRATKAAAPAPARSTPAPAPRTPRRPAR